MIERKISSRVYGAHGDNFLLGTFQGYSKKGKLKVLGDDGQITKFKEKDCCPAINLWVALTMDCLDYIDLIFSVTQLLETHGLACWDRVVTPEKLRANQWSYLSIEENEQGHLDISACNTNHIGESHTLISQEYLLMKLSKLCHLSAQGSRPTPKL